MFRTVYRSTLRKLIDALNELHITKEDLVDIICLDGLFFAIYYDKQ